MAASLEHMRDILLPGLRQIAWSKLDDPTSWGPSIAAPHIWVPKLSLPAAVAVGAAAAIIKNPEVTRRFWAGWFAPN